MEIKELTTYNENIVNQIDSLMHELSPNASATSERVKKCVESKDMHVYVSYEKGFIVGCATLCVCTTTEMVLGFVEAVVVSSTHRGKHIGRKLIERMIEDARSFGVELLHLTSNPKRIAANGLYQALGFEKKETNCYVMALE